MEEVLFLSSTTSTCYEIHKCLDKAKYKTFHFAFLYPNDTEEHVFFDKPNLLSDLGTKITLLAVWCVKGPCVRRIWPAPDLKSGLCDFRDGLEMVYCSSVYCS